MDRNEVIARPQVERSVYYQDGPRLGTPSQQAREQRLPLMVRGSPSHGLQDLLVPSIETGSSDALVESSRTNMRREVYGDFDQASYPRHVLERRRQSPAPHQIIMIDDIPQPKRRRVVHDDSGSFRPLPFRDQTMCSTAPYAESHLIHASSIQPRDFLVQNPRDPVQLNQGLLRDTQQSLTGPSGERIPIYDAPAESGYTAAIPSSLRRAEYAAGPAHQREVPRRLMSPPRRLPDNVKEKIYLRRPVAEGVRMVERGQVVRLKEPDFGPRNQAQRPSSPCFPVSSRVSRSYEMGPDPIYTDQDFIHNFSQSRLDPPLSKTRGGMNMVRDRPHQNFDIQGNIPKRLEDEPVRSFATVRPAPARSPVQYGERPT
jgi:hypothetical protein